MNNPVSEYFRGVDSSVFELAANMSKDAGYFRFGPDTICFGRSAAGHWTHRPDHKLYDTSNDIQRRGAKLELPFNPAEIADNLRNEKYAFQSRQVNASNRSRLIQAVYYLFRPFFPLSFRRHLQKFHLRGWENIPFPHWPVDRTVDVLMQKLLALTLSMQAGNKVPFIWFWPDGAQACSVMTHDVEEESGRAFCSTLMTINEQFGMPASFQIVPEVRYEVSREYLAEIRNRGFEINVQDLTHDGRLFRNYKEFCARVEKINHYGREYGAKGFRSAILYRNQEWFHLLRFSYDLSVPNVAHLDPQRGGCCTVMPYFIGDMVELPVTMTQDHTLFNVLNDYSLSLWEQQAKLVLEQNGLMGFIVHPDYIMTERPQTTYKRLLEFMVKLREENDVWIALPRDVDEWWRQRAQMNIVNRQGTLTVEGPGSERARIAYAVADGDRVVYELADKPVRVGVSGS
jgi:hypothetical protein